MDIVRQLMLAMVITDNVGYGYYRRKIKNGNKKLLYPVGSLQKSITAAIITQLIYQKKFS